MRPIDHAEAAAEIAHQGHDGHGSDDRAGYAAVAQAHALLAIHEQLVKITAVLEEGLIG